MSDSQAIAPRPVTVIAPKRGWNALGLAELWAYRELLFFFTWRDIKVRYKQTILGASWAVLQPFFTMVVFSLFFGKLAKMPSDGIPYPLFSYAALVPWTFFAGGLTQSSNRLVGSSNLIRKIYFPRLVLPISSVLSGLVDFVLALAVLLFILIPYFHYGDPSFTFTFTPRLLWLPGLMILAAVTALGVGFWLSAMNVLFRDVRYTVPFIVQTWMFATPVVYPSSLLSEKWQIVYAINPMVGVVEGFRSALLGTEPPGAVIFVSAGVSLLLLAAGALYFRRMEKSFADVV